MAKANIRISVAAALVLVALLLALRYRAAATRLTDEAAIAINLVAGERAVSPDLAPRQILPSPMNFTETGTLVSTAPEIGTTRIPARPKQVRMPLVFQDFGNGLWNLTDGQLDAIEEIRGSFLNQIGGMEQDPGDPAYLEKWQKAQPEMDAQLWFKLGKDIFQQAQLIAFASASVVDRSE